ncbi:unnamed protein product [Ectocarpus fasciculatus]
MQQVLHITGSKYCFVCYYLQSAYPTPITTGRMKPPLNRRSTDATTTYNQLNSCGNGPLYSSMHLPSQVPRASSYNLQPGETRLGGRVRPSSFLEPNYFGLQPDMLVVARHYPRCGIACTLRAASSLQHPIAVGAPTYPRPSSAHQHQL